MNQPDPASALARSARIAGDLFAAVIAAAAASDYVSADAVHRAGFEAVTAAILDKASADLAADLLVHTAGYEDQRASTLAADFLVAWAAGASGTPAAISAGDTQRLALLEVERDNLMVQLEADAGRRRPGSSPSAVCGASVGDGQ